MEYERGALTAEQSPLASHSTLNGFWAQNEIWRFPCHQRQVAHFFSFNPTFCIDLLLSSPVCLFASAGPGEKKGAPSPVSNGGTAKRLRGKQVESARKRSRTSSRSPLANFGGFPLGETLETDIKRG